MFLKNKVALIITLSFLGFNTWADELKVVVSVKPIHSIISGLMKGVSKPELLINNKQTPYDFEISDSQYKRLEKSSLFIWVGAELEKTLKKTVDKLPETVKVIELLSSPNLKILPSRENPNVSDPFFWLDDRNVIILVDELTWLLVEADPKKAHIYTRNRLEVLKPLRRIDKEYEYGYRGLKAGLGVSYYDTLQYFEQAYALKTLDRVAGTPWDDADSTGLLKVRARIESKEAVCLFVDKSMPMDNMDILTKNSNVNIGKLDVLGKNFTAGEDLYIKIMQYNTDVIKNCLNADMDEASKARLIAAEQEAISFSGLGQGRFILKDHNNKTFTEEDLKGKYALVFFGYTFCPDVCPTNLFILSQAFQKLGDTANKVIPYFISVDPQRDTSEVLRKYVAYFDKRLVGLTGSKAMIDRVVAQFKAKYEKGDVDPKNPDLYIMDHTASLYLMAPDGSFITKFAHGIDPSVLADELKNIMR